MAVSTGYKPHQIEALRLRIGVHREELRGFLPEGAMGDILLVCGCSNCIDGADYHALRRTAFAALTPHLVSRYFGGAGVLEVDTSPEAQREGMGIFLHVLDALAEATLANREVEREYSRAWRFVEPEHWHEPLYATGFQAYLAPTQQQTITDLLVDLVELGIARNLPRMTDALIFLSRVTADFARVLEGVANGPPRRHLAFWVAVAGWAPNSPAGMKNAVVTDFSNDFRFMREDDRHQLEDALADPAVEALLERYAFAARDPEWSGYLSRLVSWRENTVQRNEMNRGKPAPAR